ncbi:MAG: M1 family aminopeptidase [Phycisphaerales bacterium]
MPLSRTALASASLLCVLAGSASIALAQHSLVKYFDQNGHECEIEGCGKAQALALRAAQGLPINDFEQPPFAGREAFTDTDLLTVNYEVDIDPATEIFTGSNEMRVRSLVNGLTQFTFMLRSQFNVTQVLVNGVNNALPSTPGTNSYARTVTLPAPVNAGQEFTVKIFYNGVPVSRGFGSIEVGLNPFGDPIISTLSEAYYAATWWPVKDGDVFLAGDNGDKSTGRFSIIAPDTLKTVANGVLEGIDTLPGGKKRYRWVTNYPTSTYLWFFSTSNYNQWTVPYNYPLPGGGTGTMPVEFSIYPGDDTPANRAAWSNVVNMLTAYRPVYGEYPFINEKYGIYEFPFGGGMEHQTYTGQGTFNESVTAHELGHQWWGDNVTCKTWNHIWLNEGFATYTEGIWEERKPGSTGLPALRAAMNARRPNPTTDTVFVSNVADMNRIFSSNYTYRKGGWVLHQLRHAVGDTNFFNGLQTYRAAYQGSAATTEDFRDIMASVSGKDLTNFFDQWVYRIGHPQYAYGFANTTINGQQYTKVSIRQTQLAGWGLPSGGGRFEMPIDVRLNSASGNVTRVANNTQRTQHYLFPVTAATTSVVLDEFDWILTDSKVSEAYTAGPGKIAITSPAPGASIATNAAPTFVRIYFSENMTAPSSAFTVTGPSGTVPFTYVATGTPTQSTLTFASALPPGTYTVNVAQTVTTVAGALALDGEIAANALPSGDGLAGGAASFTFTVQGVTCDSIDFNNDTSTFDPQDIDAFLSVYAEGPCIPSTATCNDIDFNNDTSVFDPCDIDSFLTQFSEGPAPPAVSDAHSTRAEVRKHPARWAITRAIAEFAK